MSWTDRKARMDANKLAVRDAAKAICNVLREQARGGLGYYVDADELADGIEDELLPPELWEDSNRTTLGSGETPPAPPTEPRLNLTELFKAAALDDSITDAEVRNIVRFISDAPVTAEDMARTHELAERYGWERDASGQTTDEQPYASGCTEPEFPAWWEEFGSALDLDTRINSETLALAAFSVGRFRGLASSRLDAGAPQRFTENEIKDVLTALYQDGHVDLVLADRVAALMNQPALSAVGERPAAPPTSGAVLPEPTKP